MFWNYDSSKLEREKKWPKIWIQEVSGTNVLIQLWYFMSFEIKDFLHFHMVPHRKLDRIGGTSSVTFPNFKYVAPSEICAERNCFDRPIAKWELKQIFDV